MTVKPETSRSFRHALPKVVNHRFGTGKRRRLFCFYNSRARTMWREREKLLQNAVEVPHLHIARHIKYLPFGLEIAFQSRSVGEEKHFFLRIPLKDNKARQTVTQNRLKYFRLPTFL